MTRNLRHIDISRMPDLARLADEVRTTNTPRVLRQGDADVAVLISPEQWDRCQQQVMEEFFRAIDQLQERNRDADPAEVERDVTEAVEEVRRQRYERRQQTGRGP
jgi:phosphoribosylaminoimidazole-succinocarboxamide synthase